MAVSPLVQPLNPAVWLFMPAVACAAATLALATPVDIFGLRLPEPVIGMVCAFAWGVIRPSMLAPLLLVGLGVFDDLLWGDRPGLWALSLLAVYGFTLAARPALTSEGFWARWAWYGGACASGFVVAFLLASGGEGTPVNLLALSLQIAPTLLLFWFAQRLIMRFEDADVRFR